MNAVLLVSLAIAYAVMLFLLAWWAEANVERSRQWHRYSYPLALAVYCTSWTFYGAVGSAYRDGWSYLPIYLGPILLFLFAPQLFSRLISLAQSNAATTLSDLVSARFGRSRTVASAITIVMLAGMVPYIALQLRSIGATFAHSGQMAENSTTTAVVTAILLTLFALLFGTRRFDEAERNDALLLAVSAESLVKLAAFIAVAGFAVLAFLGAPAAVREASQAALAAKFSPRALNGEFLVAMLLSAAAVVCLPRQFFVTVIEARSPNDPVRARWPFAAYLGITALAVLPITLAGLAAPDVVGNADLIVIDLPRASGMHLVTMLAFIGGFSAATAMVVVETIALSTMVSNDLIAPWLLRSTKMRRMADLGGLILSVRRGAIIILMLVAFGFARAIPSSAQLASIGLVAFVAVSQIVPGLMLALRDGEHSADGLVAGLVVGGLLWAYTLLMPVLWPDWAAAMAGSLADPQRLLAFGNASEITHGALWSLGGNVAAYMLVARLTRPRVIGLMPTRNVPKSADRAALIDLVSRFVGEERARSELGKPDARLTREAARRAEQMLGEVVGAASARALIGSALSGGALTVDDVTRMLDHGGASLRFSRDLLASTLEHIDPGVSVVDRDLNLVAWNGRYLELFDYPDGMVFVGRPVADLIRYNAVRGECGPGEVDELVERRLMHMRRGSRHNFERIRPDGRVLKTVGGPMPGGGYVMCFSDITAEAEAHAQVETARAELERRVDERTRQLSEANRALTNATAEKTRFLAAASHDLLQPLHAARLFVSALERRVEEPSQPLVQQVDAAIRSADELLRTLLDISKLDAGGVEPVIEPVLVNDLLRDLKDTFAPLAGERGLSLNMVPSSATVLTDRVLLRSVVQNFLSNAVRYTHSGGVVLGVRRRGTEAMICVYDTGPGFAESDKERLFREFERGSRAEGGLGLGLAIVQRIASLLHHKIHVESVPDRGSAFGVIVPMDRSGRTIVSHPEGLLSEPEHSNGSQSADRAAALRLLVVDDDPTVIAAMGEWAASAGHHLDTAMASHAALAVNGIYDAILVDFDLGEAMDGLELVVRLRARHPAAAVALVTAERGRAVLRRATMLGVPVLPKPIAPPELERWLTRSRPAL